MKQQQNRNMFIAAYCILFYVLAVYKWFNGMFFYQFYPAFFFMKEDLLSWLFMLTGFHKKIIEHNIYAALLDTAFYILPITIWIAKNNKLASIIVALVMLVINWVYVITYTLFITNSIESHIAWLLFPLLFLAYSNNTFIQLQKALRFFFIYFLVSAALWKFIQGGIFEKEQMSNILLVQHKELLLVSPQHWYTRFIQWLIETSWISYGLYVIATFTELIFLIGVFTRKYDSWLALALVAFLLADHFLMRIPYYDVLPFVLVFFFIPRNKSAEF